MVYMFQGNDITLVHRVRPEAIQPNRANPISVQMFEVRGSDSEVIKLFFILNSFEHEIFPVHKY